MSVVCPAVAPDTNPAASPARPELDAVLREVNRIRTDRGGDAIYELPKGKRGAYACKSSVGCVLVNAFRDLGVRAVIEDLVMFGDADPFDRDSDNVCWRFPDFIRAFDSGAYPELEL